MTKSQKSSRKRMENRSHKRERRAPAQGLYSYAAYSEEDKIHKVGRWIASGTERIVKLITNRAKRRMDRATKRQAPGSAAREQQKHVRMERVKNIRRALRKIQKENRRLNRQQANA